MLISHYSLLVACWHCYYWGCARLKRQHERGRLCLCLFVCKRASERVYGKEKKEIHLANDTNDVTCNTISPVWNRHLRLRFTFCCCFCCSRCRWCCWCCCCHCVVIATQTLSNFQWNSNIIYLASHQIMACIIFLYTFNRKTMFFPTIHEHC